VLTSREKCNCNFRVDPLFGLLIGVLAVGVLIAMLAPVSHEIRQRVSDRAPGPLGQPGAFRVCPFNQLETLFGVIDQFAQNGHDARLLSNPESSSQPSDFMTQPKFPPPQTPRHAPPAGRRAWAIIALVQQSR
jgi:hypothetical protein